MTALLGYNDGKRVWLASDKRENHLGGHIDCAHKQVLFGDICVAHSGYLRGLEILHGLDLSGVVDGVTERGILDAYDAELRKRGWVHEPSKDGGAPTWDINFLIASPRGLFSVDSSLSCQWVPPHRWCGAGSAGRLVMGVAIGMARSWVDIAMESALSTIFKTAAEYDDLMSPECDTFSIALESPEP